VSADLRPSSGGALLSLAIASDPRALADAREDVAGRLAKLGVDERACHGVDLVLEELVGNVIRHGGAASEDRSIRVDFAVEPALVRVTIVDDGVAFDPTLHPEPRPPRSLSDAAVGGRGILMVCRLARSMRYAREAGRNRLEVELARHA